MNKESFYKLIKESKSLLKHANAEQKVKILKLIREGYQKINQNRQADTVLKNTSADYLEEK